MKKMITLVFVTMLIVGCSSTSKNSNKVATCSNAEAKDLSIEITKKNDKLVDTIQMLYVIELTDEVLDSVGGIDALKKQIEDSKKKQESESSKAVTQINTLSKDQKTLTTGIIINVQKLTSEDETTYSIKKTDTPEAVLKSLTDVGYTCSEFK